MTTLFNRSSSPTAKPVSAHTTTATTYYPGATDPAAAQPITVTAGETVTGIQFTMQSSPAFTVSGIVVDDEGQRVGGAMVMLTSDPRTGPMFGPAGTARTSADGRFEIIDVVPGTYRINASVPMTANGSGGEMGAFSVNGASANQPAALAVTDADVKGVRVVAHRPQ
jgi:protocatechuate 3,4-dioxygenase beta subunit